MTSLSTYWHTLRYLKPIQLYGRLRFRLARPRIDQRAPPPRRRPTNGWVVSAQRAPCLLGPDCFCFLNETHCLSEVGWDDPALAKLWRYNLHYFDDLNASGAEHRTVWHRVLLQRWTEENRPAEGTPWEPYPTSLRIVNWIKWTLSGHEPPTEFVHSLAIQARWLSKRVESHLLGNHLFANAKALVFGGAFFEGDEADVWFRQGMGILKRQIPEQILADGGHFEGSTMYHALVFEDILDLLNLTNAYPAAFASQHQFATNWKGLAAGMARWLAAVCHPDGEIAFFNDAAIGIAPTPTSLFQYARLLGISLDTTAESGVTWLRASGYVRAQLGEGVLIADVAKIGPDYLPAHAHADSLSFELSVGGQRVLVNTGTSRYGVGPQRDRQRATAAHNTLEIDGQSSSEVWAGFRVARRAYPFDVRVNIESRSTVIEAAHNGYRRLVGRPVHRRRWVMTENMLTVEDVVEGSGDHVIKIYFHFHPDMCLSRAAASMFSARGKVGSAVLHIRLDEKLACRAEPGTWHPRFGTSEENVNLTGEYRGPLPIRLLTHIAWQV